MFVIIESVVKNMYDIHKIFCVFIFTWQMFQTFENSGEAEAEEDDSEVKSDSEDEECNSEDSSDDSNCSDDDDDE